MRRAICGRQGKCRVGTACSRCLSACRWAQPVQHLPCFLPGAYVTYFLVARKSLLLDSWGKYECYVPSHLFGKGGRKEQETSLCSHAVIIPQSIMHIEGCPLCSSKKRMELFLLHSTTGHPCHYLFLHCADYTYSWAGALETTPKMLAADRGGAWFSPAQPVGQAGVPNPHQVEQWS